MQQQLVTAQEELAGAEVSGSAGGGVVTVTMSGSGEVTRIRIDPSVVDPEDVETLEDVVVAAVHAAAEEQRRLAEQKLGPLAGGLPGLGGGLPGMPGGSGPPDIPGLPGT